MTDVTLRPESKAPEASDEPFLRRLVIETMAEQLGASAWPEPMRSHLLGIQYSGRRHSHIAGYPEAASYVIQANGRDAGWLVLATLPDEVRVVEIMVSSELRGSGIGTAVLQGILSDARQAGKPVRLSVNPMNETAIRLYLRLGFRITGSDDTQHHMEAR
jgi:ribosomal protein S18 acetylase RimI-like enzyme